MKPPKKLNNTNNKVRLRDNVNDIRSRKLMLKMIKEGRKKNQRNFGKRKAIQMTDTVSTKNIEGGSSENDLNNINHTSHLNNASNEINVEYSSNQNPIINSQQLFQWLLNPVNIETFFK